MKPKKSIYSGSGGNYTMKRYIRSSTNQEFKGYCAYTAGNPTWGGDATRLIHQVGGDKAYMKLAKPDGSGYYSAKIYYVFPDKASYIEFQSLLYEHELNGLINLQQYQDLPEDAKIIELG